MPWYVTVAMLMMWALFVVAWLLVMGGVAILLWHILRDIFRS